MLQKSFLMYDEIDVSGTQWNSQVRFYDQFCTQAQNPSRSIFLSCLPLLVLRFFISNFSSKQPLNYIHISIYQSIYIYIKYKMASSSGNSFGSAQIQNSGSEGDLMDQRKRKRMQSNRESARRSRMRKQKHLDDLMAQVSQLRKENGQILSSINVTTQHYVNVESENSVLRAQMMELSQRLQSLNDILNYINSSTAAAAGSCVFEAEEFQHHGFGDSFLNNHHLWNLMGINQQHPIMASAEMFDYWLITNWDFVIKISWSNSSCPFNLAMALSVDVYFYYLVELASGSG